MLLVQSPSHAWLFETHGLQHARLSCPSPSPGVCPSSSPLQSMALVKTSNHLILCSPLLLLSIFPSIRVSGFFIVRRFGLRGRIFPNTISPRADSPLPVHRGSSSKRSKARSQKGFGNVLWISPPQPRMFFQLCPQYPGEREPQLRPQAQGRSAGHWLGDCPHHSRCLPVDGRLLFLSLHTALETS